MMLARSLNLLWPLAKSSSGRRLDLGASLAYFFPPLALIWDSRGLEDIERRLSTLSTLLEISSGFPGNFLPLDLDLVLMFYLTRPRSEPTLS